MYGGLECELMTARQGGGDQTPYHTQCLRPHYKHPHSKSLARFNLFKFSFKTLCSAFEKIIHKGFS